MLHNIKRELDTNSHMTHTDGMLGMTELTGRIAAVLDSVGVQPTEYLTGALVRAMYPYGGDESSNGSQVVHRVVVFADLGDHKQSNVIAADVTGELRSPEPDSELCDIVAPADAGAFGAELMVSIKFADLARFVHAVEAGPTTA